MIWTQTTYTDYFIKSLDKLHFWVLLVLLHILGFRESSWDMNYVQGWSHTHTHTLESSELGYFFGIIILVYPRLGQILCEPSKDISPPSMFYSSGLLPSMRICSSHLLVNQWKALGILKLQWLLKDVYLTQWSL